MTVSVTTHQLHKHSSEHMHELEDESIHLVVTSPPYNEDKPYSDNYKWSEYIVLHQTIVNELFRVLVPGGRVCINIANLGRYKKKGEKVVASYKRLSLLFWSMATRAGFIDQGEILWYKGMSANVTTAWGSYRRATKPVIRDVHEYILVFSKPGRIAVPLDQQAKNIPARDFHDMTRSVWEIPTNSDPNHPCTFPIRLAENLIRLYSYEGHTVLDPFAGSGTVADAAKRWGRNSVSYEIEEAYWPLIEDITLQTSLEEWFSQQPSPGTQETAARES